ncbi:restriction endonuclease subunit S [Gluconobacter albidus]|uniref:restriction endonuclease subunit S n=1 Tax=Gluconobacter albidus TaxID=318683 RepID=UPI001B8B2E7A|nr:restriction endonuclease subunit S [Gluconobacter albidus]MBS1029099.1 restriction endonuclease subunit S [Gluconobacter albidus]
MNKTHLCKMMDLADVTSAKRIFARDYVSAGIPFYRGKEITELHRGALNVSTDLFITVEKFLEIKKKHGAPEEGDVLLTSVGTLGSVYVVKSSDRFYFKDGNVTWFRNLVGVTGAYLRYWLISPEGRAQLQKCMIGSSQSAYTIENLKRMEIRLPSLETQGRITSILGAYDDLIEVNRRRIAALEEMARGLFEEWFVRFRFPGHEAVAIEDTPDGSLPAGWSWGRFADLASEIRDTVLPESVDPATPYIGLEHISRRSTTLAEHGTAADVSSLKARFRRGDILFGKIRPYFHKVAWAPFGGVASTDVIIWRPTAALTAQALLQASSDAFVAHSVQTSNGTKMPRANTKVLADYRCALAPSNISERFENAVGPMIESAASLQAANLILATARDLLLPRLISGQLSVTQAERELWAA